MQYLSPYCGAAVLLFFRGSFFCLGLGGGFCFRVCRGFFGRFGLMLFFRLCRSFGFRTKNANYRYGYAEIGEGRS